MVVQVHRFARGASSKPPFIEEFPSLEDAMLARDPKGVLLSYIPTDEVLLGRVEGETEWTPRVSSRPPWPRDQS